MSTPNAASPADLRARDSSPINSEAQTSHIASVSSKPLLRNNSASSISQEPTRLPGAELKGAFQRYQEYRRNEASAAAGTQARGSGDAQRGSTRGTQATRPKRKASGNGTTRHAKGKKKETLEVESNPVGYASPASITPQVPSSEPDEFAHYRFFMLPIPPCRELAPCDALYKFQLPQSPELTMVLLVRWINPYCAPVLPGELDLGPFVLRK
ncbi:hypothetical protein CPB85DRAFT_1492283, partial [Mucidula mucida]